MVAWGSGASRMVCAFVVKHTLEHTGVVHDAIYGPDGGIIATASEDGSARLWDAKTGKALKKLKHFGPVLGICFHFDDKLGTKRLATASADLTARVWDCESGQALLPVMRHYSAVISVRFSPDGKQLVTASDDNTARVWDAGNGRPLTPPITHNGEVGHAIFSKDGRYIATGARGTPPRCIYELQPEIRVFTNHGADQVAQPGDMLTPRGIARSDEPGSRPSGCHLGYQIQQQAGDLNRSTTARCAFSLAV